MTKAASRTSKPTLQATRPIPKRLAEETMAEMKRLADPKRAAGNQRYFKEPIASYGLDGPTAKGLIKELITQTKGVWTVGDAVAFCNLMVRDPNLEPRGIAYQLVAAFVKDADASLLDDVRGWLEKSCGNWALVDNLAPSVLAPLLERHPKLVPEVVGWTTSRNMWLRRASAVAFIPLVQHGQHLDTAYEVATRLFHDTEDLMHKAVGWMLREAGKKDMARFERFLTNEGPRMPRTTVRYAIERFPAEKRKALLEATRVGLASDTPRNAIAREGTRAKERRHRQGYEAKPVRRGEFDA